MSITCDTILRNQENISRQDVFEFFRQKNVLFEDKKFDCLRNTEALSFSAAVSMFSVVGLFAGFLVTNAALNCASNPTVIISSYFSTTAAVVIALSITAIVARIKKNQHLGEKLDKQALQDFLLNVKDTAYEALDNIKLYPHAYSIGVQQNIQRTYEALQNV